MRPDGLQILAEKCQSDSVEVRIGSSSERSACLKLLSLVCNFFEGRDGEFAWAGLEERSAVAEPIERLASPERSLPFSSGRTSREEQESSRADARWRESLRWR